MGYPLQYSWASLVAQLVKNLPAMGGPGFDAWVGHLEPPLQASQLLPPSANFPSPSAFCLLNFIKNLSIIVSSRIL